MTHYCPGSKPIPIQGAEHQVNPAGDATATCMRKHCRASRLPQTLTNTLDQTPILLRAVHPTSLVPEPKDGSVATSRSHISGTPPQAVASLSQDTTKPALQSPLRPLSQEIPISPSKAASYAVALQRSDKQNTEYTWPESLMDVEMTSGSEPDHTTLLPDKDVSKHPAVQRALTSLALGRTMEQDQDDIMAGVPLPIISAPLLPSLVPLNEEESILFSSIKPLQGAVLVKAAGITSEDVGSLPKKKGKKRSDAWHIPKAVTPASDEMTPHTNEPQFDTRSTSDTYEDLPFSQNLKRMVSAFPSMTEEHLSLTLEKHDNDLPTALAWMQTIAEMKHIRRTLVSAYPTASVDEVESAVKLYKGDFMLSFNLLGLDHEPTSEWSEFSFMRRKGVMDIGEEAAEVIYDDAAARSFENQWWRTCVQIKRHRVYHSEEADRLWGKLAPVAIAPRPISLRFLQYVNDLGKYNMDRPAFGKAVGVLRAQDEFNGLVAIIGEPVACFDGREADIPAIAILHILVSDGLASPAAAAWLALSVFKDKESYDKYIPLFFGFPAIRRKVWNDRNIYMAASVKTISRQGSAPNSRVDVAAARDTYMSAVPGTIKYALEKQRDKAAKSSPTKGKAALSSPTKGKMALSSPKKQKADKSSVESRGSRKSKRARGLSPNEDIPEEEEEQRDPVVDETASEALGHLLRED